MANEVVIATAEPFQRAWENELRPILRKEIRRVIANPDDISRYLVEFFNLAKSVKKGLESRLRPSSGGMTVEVSDEGRAQAIPVESMADAYMSAAGDSKARAAAVAKLVRQTMGLAE